MSNPGTCGHAAQPEYPLLDSCRSDNSRPECRCQGDDVPLPKRVSEPAEFAQDYPRRAQSGQRPRIPRSPERTGLVLLVLGWTGVVAGRNRILADDSAPASHDCEFAASLIMQVLPGSIPCFSLRLVQARRLVGIVALVDPLPVIPTEDSSAGVASIILCNFSRSLTQPSG